MLRRLFLSTVSAACVVAHAFVFGHGSNRRHGRLILPCRVSNRLQPSMTQTVPLSLTVIVPGPDGTQTITCADLSET